MYSPCLSVVRLPQPRASLVARAAPCCLGFDLAGVGAFGRRGGATRRALNLRAHTLFLDGGVRCPVDHRTRRKPPPRPDLVFFFLRHPTLLAASVPASPRALRIGPYDSSPPAVAARCCFLSGDAADSTRSPSRSLGRFDSIRSRVVCRSVFRVSLVPDPATNRKRNRNNVPTTPPAAQVHDARRHRDVGD